MQYLTLAIASALAFASQASAQMPNLPQCLEGCFNEASSVAGCSSGMDLQCICTNDKFTKPAMTCVLTKCSAEDQQTASTMYTQYCVAFTSNSTATATGTSGSATGTSPPASSTTSTSAGYSTGANLGLLVAGAGITLFTL